MGPCVRDGEYERLAVVIVIHVDDAVAFVLGDVGGGGARSDRNYLCVARLPPREVADGY